MIPFPLSSRVLAVSVSTTVLPGSNWRFGGYLKQSIQLGLPTSVNAYFSSRRLILNQVKLIVFSNIATSYTLSFIPPRWFKTATITIWKYTGADIVNL
jgi:hypothetical protein